VVVDDLDFEGIVSFPYETDSVLIVDSNAVLAFAISAKPFQTVARWHGKLPHIPNAIQLV